MWRGTVALSVYRRVLGATPPHALSASWQRDEPAVKQQNRSRSRRRRRSRKWSETEEVE
jgi:hypothetical protein